MLLAVESFVERRKAPGRYFSPAIRSVCPPGTVYSLGMRRWSLVCLLSLGIIIAYIDRTNLSVSLASADFKALFHLTDKDRGLLGSAFFWSYALLQIPAGFVVDRFGVKIPLAIGLACWCAASVATAGATFLWPLLAMRLILGGFEFGITPG